MITKAIYVEQKKGKVLGSRSVISKRKAGANSGGRGSVQGGDHREINNLYQTEEKHLPQMLNIQLSNDKGMMQKYNHYSSVKATDKQQLLPSLMNDKQNVRNQNQMNVVPSLKIKADHNILISQNDLQQDTTNQTSESKDGGIVFIQGDMGDGAQTMGNS